MQSQQSSANNHDHYNKSTRVDHAITKIAPVLSTPMHADLIKSKWTFSSSEKNGPFSLF